MSERNEGGRAFPWCGDLNETPTINLGMTLRDYFAAKAMRFPDVWFASLISHRYAARIAYHIADKMIAARNAE